MDAITSSSVTLSKKEKKAIENKRHRDRLKLNPEKTEAVRIKVHENYTDRDVLIMTWVLLKIILT